MPRMPFITFEGTEGCGKSTQVKRLTARLESLGIPFLVTREPGGTPIGETVRELLQFAPQSSGMTAETELLLFEASRSQLVREKIKPALERGLCVISDRFYDSTTVYQGAARKLDRKFVEQLNDFAVGDCRPDVTFVLGHCGFVGIDVHAVSVISAQPNIVAETSGCYTGVVRQALELLGADRLLFGTEYPLQHPAVELAKFDALRLDPEIWRKVAWLNGNRLLTAR